MNKLPNTLFDDHKRLLASARFETGKRLIVIKLTPNLKEEDYLNIMPKIRRALKLNKEIDYALVESAQLNLNDTQKESHLKLWHRLSNFANIKLALVGKDYAPLSSPQDRVRTFENEQEARAWLMFKKISRTQRNRRFW